jgi:ResB-like family
MKTFFLSLKTTVWTLFVMVCLFFAGSYQMPAHREVFTPMNEDILFRWVKRVAWDNPGSTWWFFAALAGLALLAVNTLVCSFQAVRGKWTRTDFFLRLSPQVIHAGFLFILLAHLLGAGWGYKISGMLPEGASARLPEGRTLLLHSVRAEVDHRGVPTGWSAEVALFENDALAARGTLGPNRPLLYKGTGIYLKSFELNPRPAAFLLVAKDPGAVWALVGGVLFILGSLTLLVFKWKKA